MQSDGQSRALFGWSPSPSPATSAAQRAVDRWMPTGGLPLVAYFGCVFLAISVAPSLPRRGEFALEGLAAITGAAWCGLNFWRCRHAHCLVTSVGWSALAMFAWVESALGRSLIGGDEQLVFLGILVAAVLFEMGWTRASGSNALRLHRG